MKKLNLLLIIFLFNIYSVASFSVDFGVQDIIHEDIYISFEALNNEDLKLDLTFDIIIPKEKPQKISDLTLYFRPLEPLESRPFEILNITICNGRVSGSNYDKNEIECYSDPLDFNKSAFPWIKSGYIEEGKFFKADYYEYQFLFNTSEKQEYAVQIEGLYPGVILKQSDLYIVPLYFPDVNFNYSYVYFVPPSKNTVYPYIEPNSLIRTILRYDEKGNYFNKQVYEFKDTENRLIYYHDYEELQGNEKSLVWLGVKLGFLSSAILLILELLFGTTWRYHLRKVYNKIIRSKKIIANTKTKKYHIQNCKYLDNIEPRNRIEIPNKERAEQQKFNPCKECHPEE